jgi:hypothetical protein
MSALWEGEAPAEPPFDFSNGMNSCIRQCNQAAEDASRAGDSVAAQLQ